MNIPNRIIRAKRNTSSEQNDRNPRLAQNDSNTLDKNSYWRDVHEIPAADSEQLDLLTKEARRFVDAEKKNVAKDFSKKAPWDIYPVY